MERRDQRLGHDRRLCHKAEYQAVYTARTRASRGPLTIYALPGPGRSHRMGLSVGRAVGNAVMRNRVKRRLREAFRTVRQDLPGKYDLVVTVRPHDVEPVGRYRQWITDAVLQLHERWSRA